MVSFWSLFTTCQGGGILPCTLGGYSFDVRMFLPAIQVS
jgi:hypothetical protein